MTKIFPLMLKNYLMNGVIKTIIGHLAIKGPVWIVPETTTVPVASVFTTVNRSTQTWDTTPVSCASSRDTRRCVLPFLGCLGPSSFRTLSVRSLRSIVRRFSEREESWREFWDLRWRFGAYTLRVARRSPKSLISHREGVLSMFSVG